MRLTLYRLSQRSLTDQGQLSRGFSLFCFHNEKKTSASRESNPGTIDGNDRCYHYITRRCCCEIGVLESVYKLFLTTASLRQASPRKRVCGLRTGAGAGRGAHQSHRGARSSRGKHSWARRASVRKEDGVRPGRAEPSLPARGHRRAERCQPVLAGQVAVADGQEPVVGGEDRRPPGHARVRAPASGRESVARVDAARARAGRSW